jgi:hypothetical protein
MEYKKDYRKTILLIICLVLLLPFLLYSNLKNEPILLSLLSGAFTCFLTVLVIEINDSLKFRKALVDLDSKDWVGYALQNRTLIKHKTENGREINSYVIINYLQDNILSIKLTHETDDKENSKITWEGIIETSKQNLNTGTLTFKYTHNLEAGSKQIYIHRNKENIYIYLVPQNNALFTLQQQGSSIIAKYDYGIEVLVKKR